METTPCHVENASIPHSYYKHIVQQEALYNLNLLVDKISYKMSDQMRSRTKQKEESFSWMYTECVETSEHKLQLKVTSSKIKPNLAKQPAGWEHQTATAKRLDTDILTPIHTTQILLRTQIKTPPTSSPIQKNTWNEGSKVEQLQRKLGSQQTK